MNCNKKQACKKSVCCKTVLEKWLICKLLQVWREGLLIVDCVVRCINKN